ncbi:MAG: Gfo/Idh/MocA family oxidoreductase [Planctomycetaceae bacterium]
MRKFRAAVIGTGFIGPVHVEGLRRAGIEVVASIGSTPEKSRLSAKKLGIHGPHRTFADVLADPEIDSVHLTTPNRFHFEQAKAVLQAGKHVICEKPLAMNSSQSSTLVDIASRSGCAAGVAYNVRFYPLCHEAADRVRSGLVGTVFSATGSYVQDWLLYETDYNWRLHSEDGGELRAVADIGSHWLDLVQFIAGQPVTSVCADLRTIHDTRRRPSGHIETFSGVSRRGQSDSPCSTEPGSTEAVRITTEDCGAVMLRFQNGANGCLWVSQVTAGRKNCLRLEMAGSESSLAWNSETPNELWIGHRAQANQLLVRDPSLMGESGASVSNYPGGHNEGFPDTFKQLFHCFYEYIAIGDRTTPPPFPTFADGHRNVVLCESILSSHQSRSWVDVLP